MEAIFRELKNEHSNLYVNYATGGGKTLVALCSILDFLDQSKIKAQIIYCARTHDQLKDVAD